MNPVYGPLFVPALAIIGALIHLAVSRTPRTTPRVLEVLLLWGFGFVVGFGGLVVTASHLFLADTTAEQIGFPAGNPFQFEVAMANLAFAVIGLLCLRYRDQFWNATAIGFAVFYLGAAAGHLDQYFAHGNDAPYNMGALIYTDIAIPVVIAALLIALRRYQHRHPPGAPATQAAEPSPLMSA